MSFRRRSARFRPLALTATSVALLAFGLGACDAGGKDDRGASQPKAAAGPSVVAPGRPGEPARTLSADEAAKESPDDSPNSADFSYTHMMIKHHQQALVMAELAPKQAHSTQVKRLAERIAGSQRPEIGAMQGWLDNHDEAKRKGGHEHGAMAGMASEKQLGQLRGAKGEAFDRLFLKLMITHHEGAVSMATDVLAQGNNVLIEEMASDVVAQQTVEVGRMRDMK
ncbi:DUF305 domain-containing protein [Streptomyces sp. 21So2-11]|uniref:DUF305 domain-containing protein n=1 Tax=Streptomyces sp. 21So2-11 TaxID=3144408 RepID=UPI00321B0352